jgi:hypothetical protein
MPKKAKSTENNETVSSDNEKVTMVIKNKEKKVKREKKAKKKTKKQELKELEEMAIENENWNDHVEDTNSSEDIKVVNESEDNSFEEEELLVEDVVVETVKTTPKKSYTRKEKPMFSKGVNFNRDFDREFNREQSLLRGRLTPERKPRGVTYKKNSIQSISKFNFNDYRNSHVTLEQASVVDLLKAGITKASDSGQTQLKDVLFQTLRATNLECNFPTTMPYNKKRSKYNNRNNNNNRFENNNNRFENNNNKFENRRF